MKLIKYSALALALTLTSVAFADSSAAPKAPVQVAQHHGHGHGHGHGWGDGWGGGWGGGHGFMRMCVARNARGMRFVARGPESWGRLRREALHRCRMNSFIPQSCRIVFCN